MSTLATIAQGMRKQLAAVETGYVNRVLFGGLVIVLERRHAQWRLVVGRDTAPPGKSETEVVASAFGVPPGAAWYRMELAHQIKETHEGPLAGGRV